MVQVIPGGNKWSMAGNNFGQGISEQIPKEVEHYRLSQGLKNLSENSQGLSPEQYLAKAYSTYGMQPAMATQFGELARQRAQRGEGIGGGLTQEKKPVVSTPPIEGIKENGKETNKFPTAEDKAKGKRPLKSKEATSAQIIPFVPKTAEEKFERQKEISNKMPQTYPTPLSASPFVEEEERIRKENYDNLKASGNAADVIQQNMVKGLKDYAGEAKVNNAKLGKIFNSITRDMESELADPENKLSESQLITKYGDVLKNITKSYDTLKNRSQMWYTNPDYSQKNIITDIEKTRKEFAKHEDGLEDFKDILSSEYNFTDPMASYWAYGQNNKEINKFFNENAKEKYKNTIVTPKERKKRTVELADKISPYITDNDSLSSYAMEAKAKGLDPQVFLDRINQNGESGIFTLSPRHDLEIKKGIPTFPSIGDIFISGKVGKEELLE